MTGNAEVFYCPICEWLAWNRETHIHDQDMRLLAELDENTATADDLTLAILSIPAADRTDPGKVAAALLARFDVTHRATS